MQSFRSRSETFAHITWLMGTDYAAEAAYLVRGVVLAALLGPQAFGIWSSMRIITRFLPYAPAGAIQGMLQLSPGADARGEQETARELRGTTVALTALAAIIVTLVVLSISAWSAEDTFIVWVLFAAVLALIQLNDVQVFVLRSQQQFLTVGTIKLTIAVGTLVLGVAAAWLFGLGGFLVAIGIVLATVSAVTVVVTASPPRPKFKLATAVSLIKTGSPILLAEACLTLLQNVDKLLVVTFMGSHALGVYAVPSYVVQATYFVPQAVTNVLYPRLLATIDTVVSPRSSWPYLERATVWVSYVIGPVLVGLALIIHIPISLWLPEYQAAIGPGRVLILVAFFPLVAMVPAMVLIAMNMQARLVRVRLMAVLVTAFCVLATVASSDDLALIALSTAPGMAFLSIATLRVALSESDLPSKRQGIVFGTVYVPYVVLLAIIYLVF
jgi:O-antigen/teichoic acid export membrane protein